MGRNPESELRSSRSPQPSPDSRGSALALLQRRRSTSLQMRQTLVLIAAEAEIAFDQARIRGNFRWRSLRGDRAELHHIGIIRDFKRGPRILFDQQDRNPGLPQIVT